MHHLFFAAALAGPLLFGASPAQAQGFLKRLAERAIQTAEQGAERIVEDVGNGDGGSRSEAGGQANRRGGGAPPVLTPRAVRSSGPRAAASVAAPVSAPATSVRYTDDLPRAADAEAAKAAYNKFGEVSCNDCEGGIDFDGRPKFAYDQFSGQYEERARRFGNLPVGHVHRWRGRESTGTITILAEQPLDGFRCKQLRYRLVKGKAVAERPGLICWGLANASSSAENWHEIY